MMSKETLEAYRNMMPGERLKLTFQAMREATPYLLLGPPEIVDRRFEAIRRENAKDGVYLLENLGEKGWRVKWQPITVGINNTTRAEVKELKEGDAAALPTDLTLIDGMLVQPKFP